jgi:hypothetical protein
MHQWADSNPSLPIHVSSLNAHIWSMHQQTSPLVIPDAREPLPLVVKLSADLPALELIPFFETVDSLHSK